MLDFHFQKPFRKQLKLMQKQGRDLSKLHEVIGMIINEKPLPPKYETHPLHGIWEGSRDCHIQGDWVLIYKINDAAHTVTFQRTDSHSGVF